MNVVELFEKTIAGTLSESERDELQELVINDREVRRAYIEYLDLHGSLYWNSTEAGRESFAILDAPKAPEKPIRFRPAATLLKIAACVALLAGGMWLGRGAFSSSPDTIAILEEAKNCRWSSGSLPTNSGAELGAGTLSLTEGLATIVFTSGATVQLEGPAELRLIDAMRCELMSGTLVAEVPEPAKGFTVDTKTAELIDYGTEFGVSVDGTTGETQLEVFSGEVDIAPRHSGEIKRVTGGQKSRVRGDFFEVGNSQSEETIQLGLEPLFPEGTRTIEVSEDAYVAGPGTNSHSSDTLLLAKTPIHSATSFSRKVYLQFELSAGDISSASLELWLRRSGFGYASFVDDATFRVYGLKENRRWNEASLTWENAPGNQHSSKNGVLRDEALDLGTFVVPQGIDSGRIEFSSPALVDFLSDRTGPVTLIVVRETVESRGGGVVHAFASSRDPSGGTPKLRVR